MSETEELTDERIAQIRELIDLQNEEIRTGKKANEEAIKLWLKKSKYGQAITGATKATTTLTKGFVDSATAMADSTGDFGSLSGAVGGTVKSMSSLAGAVSNVFGAIPFAGDAIDALGDATIAFTKFGMAELQKSFNTFQDLSEAGQMGAGGIEEMTKRMRATNMPLATYSKLLKENSTDLAFLSESALAGGKTFSKTMVDMASDTGMPLRRLGLSVAEIGDTVVDFQVMQRRQGLLGQLSQEQIKSGTAEYAKELDLIAKITGKNRKEVQKEREEAMSDSRFRAAMMDRSQEEQQQHMDAIAQISDPTLKRAYMDQVSGFTNSTASITAEITGMGGAIRGAIEHIDDLGGNSTDAINIMRKQALAVTEAGGVLQSYSKVVESGGGVMMNFATLRDFSIETLKSQKAAADAQLTQMESVGSAAHELATGMKELQKGTAIMNALFTETATASKVMGQFAKIQTTAMEYAEDLLNSEDPGQKIIDDAANKIAKEAVQVAKNIQAAVENIGNELSTSMGFGSEKQKQALVKAQIEDALLAHKKELSAPGGKVGLKPTDSPVGLPTAGPSTPKQDEYTVLKEQRDKQSKKISDFNTIADSDNNFTTAEKAQSDRMTQVLEAIDKKLARLNDTTDRAARNATGDARKQLRN